MTDFVPSAPGWLAWRLDSSGEAASRPLAGWVGLSAMVVLGVRLVPAAEAGCVLVTGPGQRHPDTDDLARACTTNA